MAISDAQFAAWLDNDYARRRVLFELDYVYQAEGFVDPDIIYTPTVGTIYLADGDYQTMTSDTPASTAYVDVVRGDPGYRREIDRRTLTGRGSVSIGSLDLVNPDGSLDFLLDLAVDGSQVRCYLGDASWSRADFRLLYTAFAERIEAPDENRLTVGLRDGAALLNASIGGTLFLGGTGPNAERVKPINYGYCNNVECLQLDSADLTYVYGIEAGVVLGSVRDSGLSVSDLLAYSGTDSVLIWDTGTDRVAITAHGYIDEDIVYLSSSGTFPTGLSEGYWFVRNKTADDFQLSATRTGSVADITSAAFSGTLTITRYNYADHLDGTFTLAHPPFGIVTCDVSTLVSFSGRSAHYASDIIMGLVRDHSTVPGLAGLCTPDHFTIGDESTFDAADLDFLLGVRVEDKRNLLDILDDVAFSGLIFYGFNKDGEFVFGRIDPTIAGTSAMDFTNDDLRAPLRVNRADPNYYSYNFIFNKNWKVQSEFVGAVPDEDIAKYSSKGRFGSGVDQGIIPGDPPVSPPYANIPEQYHLTMAEGSETETLLSAFDATDAYLQGTAWFRQRRAIFFPYLEFIDLTVGLRAWQLELGEVVQITRDRFGFGAGVKGQIVGIGLRPSKGEVDLTICRRRVCDVSEDLHLA